MVYGEEYPGGKPLTRRPWADRKGKNNVGKPTPPPTELLRVCQSQCKDGARQSIPRKVIIYSTVYQGSRVVLVIHMVNMIAFLYPFRQRLDPQVT